MNRQHLSHGIWLGIAALTFGLGWWLKPSTPPPAEPAGATAFEFRASSPSALPGAVRGETSGVPVESESGELISTADRPLTSDEIASLGEQFRSALDPFDRRLAFSKLIASMTPDNALEIRGYIDHLPAEHQDFRDFHFAWGKIAGDEAVLHGADTRKPDMLVTLAGYAAADPAAALAWFDGLPERSSRENRNTSQDYLKMGLVTGLATINPDRAADFVIGQAGRGDGAAHKMMAVIASKVMQSRGPGAAAAWTASLPEGELRNAATGHVAHDFARRDPRAAAEWAESVGSERAVAAVGHQWAQRDGAAAVGWLDSLGDRADGSAYFHTFEAWVGRDPRAASQHLVEMPPSPQRDMSINGMVNRHRWDDPQSAIAWAGEIQNREQRQGALRRIGEAFMRRDRAGAEQWIPTSGLPAEVQQRLLQIR